MQLHGTIEDIVSILNRVGSVLPTVKAIVQDPAFFGVANRIWTLHEIEAAKPGSSSGPPGTGAGIGLQQFIMPLDALIYVRRNPWALWAGIGAIVAIIGGIGYRMGQQRAPR